MNQRNFFWVLVASVIFTLPSCESGEAHEHMAEVNLDSVKAQIVTMESAYSVASNAKNVDGVAAYYASDAQSMASEEPTRVGMDAIKAGIQKDMAGDTLGHTISFVTTGVWASGNIAVETGTSSTADKEGKVVRTGKYITLFELRDGKYIAIRDMWNADAPKPTK